MKTILILLAWTLVGLPGGLRAQVCDFAADPNLPHLLFQQPFDLCGEFADRQNPPRLFHWEQLAEIPL